MDPDAKKHACAAMKIKGENQCEAGEILKPGNDSRWRGRWSARAGIQPKPNNVLVTLFIRSLAIKCLFVLPIARDLIATYPQMQETHW